MFEEMDDIINDFFTSADELIEKYQQKTQNENK